MLEPPDAIELPPLVGRGRVPGRLLLVPPGPPVLQHVSFKAEPGQTIALVGATGSGKTTDRQPDPALLRRRAAARCSIDGHDVRDVELPSLRQQIGIVMQETTLFSGTIRDEHRLRPADATDAEIELGRPRRPRRRVHRAPAATATTRIVGERGVSLSGGQKQRIAIARALLMDPRILILDEFTSAVDAATERLIRQALVELMRGRTTFVIAHRLSTVRAADQILVLQRGRLVDSRHPRRAARSRARSTARSTPASWPKPATSRAERPARTTSPALEEGRVEPMMMGGPGGGGGHGPGPRGGGPGGMGLDNVADEDGVVYDPQLARRALAYLGAVQDRRRCSLVLMTFASAALLTVGPVSDQDRHRRSHRASATSPGMTSSSG